MDFNFFEWLRNMVKRTVLLGVSDAVEHMGTPSDEVCTRDRDKILAHLRCDEPQAIAAAPPSRRLTGGSSSTRKLGRSIAEIHQD